MDDGRDDIRISARKTCNLCHILTIAQNDIIIHVAVNQPRIE
jgi:hypothetical protein